MITQISTFSVHAVRRGGRVPVASVHGDEGAVRVSCRWRRVRALEDVQRGEPVFAVVDGRWHSGEAEVEWNKCRESSVLLLRLSFSPFPFFFLSILLFLLSFAISFAIISIISISIILCWRL